MKQILLGALALATSSIALAQTAVQPSNAAPERDSRGIAVVSSPATAPAGANQAVSIPPGAKVVVAADQSAAFTATASTGELPPCSKTVTDRCKQTYEKGGR